MKKLLLIKETPILKEKDKIILQDLMNRIMNRYPFKKELADLKCRIILIEKNNKLKIELKSSFFKKEVGFLLSYNNFIIEDETEQMFKHFDEFIEKLFQSNSLYQYFSNAINVLIVDKDLVDKYKEIYLKLNECNKNKTELKYECGKIENLIMSCVAKDLKVNEIDVLRYKNLFLNNIREFYDF